MLNKNHILLFLYFIFSSYHLHLSIYIYNLLFYNFLLNFTLILFTYLHNVMLNYIITKKYNKLTFFHILYKNSIFILYSNICILHLYIFYFCNIFMHLHNSSYHLVYIFLFFLHFFSIFLFSSLFSIFYLFTSKMS